MKRNDVFHFAGKTVLRNALFTTILLFSSEFYATAQQPANLLTFTNGSISYQTSVGEELIFNLIVENENSNGITVSIVNAYGEKIFIRTFKEKRITKKFKVSDDTGNLILVIGNLADKSTRQFKISTERRYVQDVLVKRVY